MQDNSATRRNFDSMSVPGLSEEARHAVNAAFDAMLRRWLRLLGRSDGRSKSRMPPARKYRASRKCRSK